MEGSIPDDVRRFVLTSIPTVPHLETLLLLWRDPRPGWTAEQIAERTAMDKVAVSRAVAGLLEAGLLRRRAHGADRRRSVLELSARGYRVYDEVAPLALAYERRLLAGLDPADRAALHHLLDKLDASERHSRET